MDRLRENSSPKNSKAPCDKGTEGLGTLETVFQFCKFGRVVP